MSAHMMYTPLTPFAPHDGADHRLVDRVHKMLSWPKRWWDNAHTPDLRAELGEREWLDVGAGPRDCEAGPAVRETAEERAARRRAVRAWYGDARETVN